MCGWKAYTKLPANTTTVCTPITVTDHTYIITAVKLSSRTKRFVEFKEHDPIWGSNVPTEHRYWSTGDRVSHALFPNIGVVKVALRVETIDYRFQSFVNATIDVVGALTDTVSATRLMALQTRMAVDLALAPQGGVCAMIGEHCCTYIPDHNETVVDALHTMKNLRDTMAADLKASQGWLDWLFSGSWSQVLIKIIGPFLIIVIVFILLCIFSSMCVIPLTKRTVSRLFIAHMYHYNLIHLDDVDEDVEVEKH